MLRCKDCLKRQVPEKEGIVFCENCGRGYTNRYENGELIPHANRE